MELLLLIFKCVFFVQGGITTGAVELDSTLTAFVLIAMLESEETCNGVVNVSS